MKNRLHFINMLHAAFPSPDGCSEMVLPIAPQRPTRDKDNHRNFGDWLNVEWFAFGARGTPIVHVAGHGRAASHPHHVTFCLKSKIFL